MTLSPIQRNIKPYSITLTLSSPAPVVLIKKNGEELDFRLDQIKWGINWNEEYSTFLEKVKRVSEERLALCFYPANKSPPEELWMFEAVGASVAQVEQARLLIEEARADQLSAREKAEMYLLALKAYQLVHNMSPHPDVSRAIASTQNKLFIARSKYLPQEYLPESLDRKEFQGMIDTYKRNVEDIPFLHYLVCGPEATPLPKRSAAQSLMGAIVHEILEETVTAAQHYLDTAQKVYCFPFSSRALYRTAELIGEISSSHAYSHFLERVDRWFLEALFKQSEYKDLFLKEFLEMKSTMRTAFEKCLGQIKSMPFQSPLDRVKEGPTCFVCFALEKDERDIAFKVENWLSKVFVPDIEKIGIRPIFGPWHLSYGLDLDRFQDKIRNTDLVAVICTPRLKRLCDDRLEKQIEDLTGSAREIYVARQRFCNKDKQNTIFLVHPRGNRNDTIPDSLLSSIFSSIFTTLGGSTDAEVFSYYFPAIRLYMSLKGYSDASRQAVQLQESFFSEASDIISRSVYQPIKHRGVV